MTRKWDRNRRAEGLACLCAALSFLLVVCTGAGFALIVLHNQYLPGIGEKDYTESDFFISAVEDDFFCLIQSIGERDFLEEKTEDGADRVIDLQSVLDDGYGEYRYENVSGIAYRVADIKKWAMSEWQYMEGDLDKKVIVCQKQNGEYDYYYYSDFVNLFTDGDLRFIVPDMEKYDAAAADSYRMEMLEQLGTGGNGYDTQRVRAIADKSGAIVYVDYWDYGAILAEKYAPMGAEGLLEVVNENPAWNGRLSEAISALQTLLQRYENMMYRRERLDEEGYTNLDYLYVDTKEHRVFTNCSAYSDYQKYTQSLAQMTRADGTYILVRPLLSECGTTLDTSFLQQWQQAAQEEFGTEDYIFAVSIDESFPVKDRYAQMKEEYDRCVRLAAPLFAAVLLSGVLFLASMVRLTILTGKKEAGGNVRLYRHDRLYTEILLLGILADILWFWALADRAQRWFGTVGFWLRLAVYAVVAIVIFLVLYRSVLRKGKAGLLWHGSLTRIGLARLRSFGKLFLQDLDGNLRRTAAVSGFFLLTLFLLSRTFLEGDNFIPLFFLVCAGILVYAVHKAGGQKKILDGLRRITEGELQYKIPLQGLRGEQKMIAEYVNKVGDGLDAAVENSLKNERMQTDLITNVSHDLKTPLTSIINYVDLLKRENLQDPKVREYIDILEKKAQRLKTLAEDVVEASRASSGNITLHMERLNFLEMTKQAVGEFQERFDQSGLQIMTVLPEEPVMIRADGRRMWRVLENIFQNAAKYAMEDTRVYVELKVRGSEAEFSMKNISAQPLNFSADELMERFIRGDMARNTEGSGLGLSIARSLTELQKGQFRLFVDGDLFRVNIIFPIE